MVLVNFYKHTPSDEQIASDLTSGEVVVFTHMTSGAEDLEDKVKMLVGVDINMRNENVVQPWGGEDYFVMVDANFEYGPIREKLRAMALQWFGAGCPNQAKYI